MGRPKGTGGKAKELSSDEIRRVDKCLVGAPNEKRNRALFFLGLGSGMRIGEMCALRIKDIVHDGHVLRQVVLEKHSTKSRRSRTVHLGRQAVTHLRAYLEERDTTDIEAPLFPARSKPGTPLSANSGIYVITTAFQRAGIRHASSHSLRRTHANMLRRNGADLKIIQEQLGHSSLATTERYFVVDPLEKARAIDKLWF